MTTNVTIKTHTWPVKLTVNDNHNSQGKKSRRNGYICEEEFVPANSERTIAVTNTRSVVIEELPEGATDLEHADRLRYGEPGEATLASASGSVQTLRENDYAPTPTE